MGEIVTLKTTRHLWLEQRVPQLSANLADAIEDGNKPLAGKYKRSLTTLNDELQTEKERYQSKIEMDKAIEQRRNW